MDGHPEAASTDAGGTSEAGARSVPDLRRLAGEDAPIWLSTAFAAVGTLIAIASVLAWLSAPVTPASPAAVAYLAAEPNRLAEGVTPQLSPAQENAAGSTVPQSPIAASSELLATPLETVAATKPIEREVVKPKMTQDAGAASVPPYCFSAFNIPFARNSALPITKGLGQSIELLRRLMTEHPEVVLLVEGHADSTGTEQYNVLLSFSRAKAVADLLGHVGIPIRRMTVRAAGASEAKDKAAGLASDRRTFIRIDGVENCNGAGGATEEQ